MQRSVLVPLDFYEIKYWLVFFVHSNSFQLKVSIIISNTKMLFVILDYYEIKFWHSFFIHIHVFERKVYRRILGPVYEKEKEKWRILTNKEIYALL